MAARNTAAVAAKTAGGGGGSTSAAVTPTPANDTLKGSKKDGRKDIRRLAADVDALRAEVATLTDTLRSVVHNGATAPSADGGSSAFIFSSGGESPVSLEEEAEAAEALARLRAVLHARAGSGDPAVALGYSYPANDSTDKPEVDVLFAAPLAAIGAADDTVLDTAVARIATAFAAPPKAALARLLLAGDGPQSAAALGAGAHLTTGSLYHHLREMTHAGILTAAGRSRYALTPEGRFATLLLLALARRNEAD